MLRIKEIVKSKETTMQDIADKLEMNRVSLSRIINGNPTIETLEKIAHALDVQLVELFTPIDKDGVDYEYDVEPYDTMNAKAQTDYLNDKSKHGWELISATKMPMETVRNIPTKEVCIWFYFRRIK